MLWGRVLWGGGSLWEGVLGDNAFGDTLWGPQWGAVGGVLEEVVWEQKCWGCCGKGL